MRATQIAQIRGQSARFRLVLAASLVIVSGLATALELDGVKLPERARIGPDGSAVVLNGAGVRQQAVFRIYVAALYLPSRNSDGEAILGQDRPRRLALHFLRGVKAKQFNETTNEALRETLTSEERRPLESRMNQLNDFLAKMPDIVEGTEIYIDYLPKTGTVISINGKEQRRIPGADFNKALMRIWLGDRPRDPKLKQAMLGAL
ncbi:MAG: putative lipoprotein transrane [Betaproteobacteria bacterium]|nr:putative lipoprotein transrane [Betaproteobacteria bacterium]